MKMTPDAFHTWCQHLGLTSETEALVASIRSSSPVRRVNSRTGNITGRFPSPKMGVSIQFESAHVEFWAIYAMERDPDVLEYYDQPCRIPLTYLAKSGKRTTQWHTPDFFVIRRESAGFEEWKAVQAFEPLASSQPARYQIAGTGQWRCPPGETYAAHLGLTYRLRSSAELHPLEIQNLTFLQDFWAHEVPTHPEQESLALAHIQAHPGTTLSDLLATYQELSVDSIWVLLSAGRAFTGLSATLLMPHEQVFLYAEEGQVRAAGASDAAALSIVLPEAPVAWDGRLWTIEGWGEMVVHLRPELGEVYTMPRTEFDWLKQEGSLWVVGAASPSSMAEEVRQAISQASHHAQQRANHRMLQMLAYARGEPTSAPRRSVQHWWKAFQEAQETHGSGYLGLLDRVAARGNRTQRTDPVSWELLDAALQTHYAAPQGKSAAAVYRLYCGQCEKRGIPPLSQQTFYRARARFTTTEVIAKRHGSRAAYAAGPFCWLDQTTPRHGDRPFALAHLDHTPLDIVLLIPYSEEFLMLTCPATRSRSVKLDAARGIVVNGLRYYHPLMRSSREAGKHVEVRYESFNIGIAYAFVDGQWLTCTADAFLQVQGRSERTWELILDEWREQQRAHGRKRMTIDSSLLGTFLEEVLLEEPLLKQQHCDLEETALREAILGKPNVASLPLEATDPEMDEEIDLTMIPSLEEYC